MLRIFSLELEVKNFYYIVIILCTLRDGRSSARNDISEHFIILVSALYTTRLQENKINFPCILYYLN